MANQKKNSTFAPLKHSTLSLLRQKRRADFRFNIPNNKQSILK